MDTVKTDRHYQYLGGERHGKGPLSGSDNEWFLPDTFPRNGGQWHVQNDLPLYGLLAGFDVMEKKLEVDGKRIVLSDYAPRRGRGDPDAAFDGTIA